MASLFQARVFRHGSALDGSQVFAVCGHRFASARSILVRSTLALVYAPSLLHHSTNADAARVTLRVAAEVQGSTERRGSSAQGCQCRGRSQQRRIPLECQLCACLWACDPLL